MLACIKILWKRELADEIEDAILGLKSMTPFKIIRSFHQILESTV